MALHIHPNPVVETAHSGVATGIYVITNPSFAGDEVNISSSQLEAACGGKIHFAHGHDHLNNIQVGLNDRGRVAVQVYGRDCAPGSSVVEADLTVAPFYTALTTVTAKPPRKAAGTSALPD